MELHLLCWHAHTSGGRLDASMPGYAICGTVEAKPLNVQRSTINRIREGTHKPDIRSDSSVKLFWHSSETSMEASYYP